MGVDVPRLVATDLDGTLLRSDGTVSPRTAGVLAALGDRGVPVLFVTARPVRWMTALREHVGQHGLAICANGAVLLDLRTGTVERARTIPVDAAHAAVAAIRAAVPGSVFALEGLRGFAREGGFRERTPAPPGSPVGAIEGLITDGDVVKLLARHEDVGVAEFRAAVAAAVTGVEATASDATALVELSAAGVTKASMLQEMCAGLGIDRADVVAFGDAPNDVPMLAWAGRSFAMARADPALDGVVTDRTADNDEDGVARALEQLFGL